MDTKTSKAWIYTRTASVEQGPSGLQSQREACEAHAAALGLEVSPERYEDAGASGLTLDRPGLDQLLADVEAGEGGTVLVESLDRVSRKAEDAAEVIDRVRRAGAELKTSR